MDISFSPRAIFLSLLAKWPELLLSALLGAAMGLLISRVLPAQYRAAATLSIDHNVAEAFNNQIDLDIASYLNRETNRLESYAYSDEVWQQIEASLIEDGWTEQVGEIEDLRTAAVLPHSQDGAWLFLATTTDQQFSEALASAWATIFFENVTESILSADKKQQVLDEISNQSNKIAARGAECAEIRVLANETDRLIVLLQTESEFDPILQVQIERLALGILPEASVDETLEAQITRTEILWTALETELSLCVSSLEMLTNQFASNEALLQELERASAGISPYLEVRLEQDARETGRATANDARFMFWAAILGASAWIVYRVVRLAYSKPAEKRESPS